MEGKLSSIFAVKIDFDQSHLFFPKIIVWLLILLFIMIVVIYGKTFVQDLRSGRRKIRLFQENYDKIKLFGTILAVVIYFILMDIVGTFFPNTGLGFLLVSIPFMLALSFLYVHDLNRKKAMIIVLNSTIAPVTAWYILGNLFNISLP
jgi:hypothetical protein